MLYRLTVLCGEANKREKRGTRWAFPVFSGVDPGIPADKVWAMGGHDPWRVFKRRSQTLAK